MKPETKKAWRDLAIFVMVFCLILALAATDTVDNLVALTWLAVMAVASVILIWRFWKARRDPELAKSILTNRWASILPAKLNSWLAGDHDDSKRGDENN